MHSTQGNINALSKVALGLRVDFHTVCRKTNHEARNIGFCAPNYLRLQTRIAAYQVVDEAAHHANSEVLF